MKTAPLKPDCNLDIADGEYLHYSDNVNGKKYADNYFVAKKIVNQKGELNYKIYYAYITAESGKNVPADYTQWPSYFIIDPKCGVLIEINNKYDIGDVREKKDLAGYSQRYYQDEGTLNYNIKTVNEGVPAEISSMLKIDRFYPLWSQLPFTFYSIRFLDAASGGALNYANPLYAKIVNLFSFRIESKESLQTKAGSFETVKACIQVEKPFVIKLIMKMMKKTRVWFEDSNRKTVIKMEFSNGSEYILEEYGKK